MPKKMMKMNKEKDMCGCDHCCDCNKTWFIVGGIIAILLGLSLWVGWFGLDLTKVVAILLILMGIKKLFWSCKC